VCAVRHTSRSFAHQRKYTKHLTVSRSVSGVCETDCTCRVGGSKTGSPAAKCRDCVITLQRSVYHRHHHYCRPRHHRYIISSSSRSCSTAMYMKWSWNAPSNTAEDRKVHLIFCRDTLESCAVGLTYEIADGNFKARCDFDAIVNH